MEQLSGIWTIRGGTFSLPLQQARICKRSRRPRKDARCRPVSSLETDVSDSGRLSNEPRQAGKRPTTAVPMRNIKLTVAYDGTDFAGWQRQPNQRTVQGALEHALARATRQHVAVRAASRTDKGVHALGQVACFEYCGSLPLQSLQRAVNAWLPDDVVVTGIAEVSPWFHPNRDAASKCYRYVICNGPIRSVFWRRYCWQYPRTLLDVETMQAAAALLLGVHDFRSFQSRGSPRENTVRTLFAVRVARCDTPLPLAAAFPGAVFQEPALPHGSAEWTAGEGQGRARGANWIIIEVVGDGFLYQMVRTLVGTLVEVGRGKRPAHWVADVLAAKDRCCAGPTAPGGGLCLAGVDYAGKDRSPAGPAHLSPNG